MLDEGLQNHRPVVICAARKHSDRREKGFANTVPCTILNTLARERQPRSSSMKTMILGAALCAVAAAHNATAVHHPASRGGRSRATTSLLVVVAIVFCAVAACVKSHRTTIEEKPIAVEATIDEESKEGPDDELSASRHAKPVAPVEAVPEDTRVRAVSFDIEQPVVSPLQESRANSSKWSLVKPS
jgi:hypothetical protein